MKRELEEEKLELKAIIIGGLGMFGLLALLCLALFCLTSCSSTRYVPIEQSDSTYVEKTYIEQEQEVEVPLPDEKVKDVLDISPVADTSKNISVSVGDSIKARTSLAEAVAWIGEDRKLHLKLRNRTEEPLKATVKYYSPAITQKSFQLKTVVREVERELTWWENIRIELGGWAIAGIFIFLALWVLQFLRRRS